LFHGPIAVRNPSFLFRITFHQLSFSDFPILLIAKQTRNQKCVEKIGIHMWSFPQKQLAVWFSGSKLLSITEGWAQLMSCGQVNYLGT